MQLAPSLPVAGPMGQDADRIRYSRMCRRILYGEHLQDVTDRIALQIPEVRREAWGHPDMASNPYKAVWTSLSTLYDRAPSVSTVIEASIESAQGLADRAAEQGFWSLQARGQRDCLALRELWMRVSVVERSDAQGFDPVYEPVYPDMVCAVASADKPNEPHTVWHARLRKLVDGTSEWMWDYVSIENPEAPAYRVYKVKGDELIDVSAAYAGEGPGEWPALWRDSTGRPVLPYVLYHAAQTPYLYDPYQTKELVEGTLNVAVLRTYVAHVARSAAWRQRYGVDVQPMGSGTVDENGDGRTRSRVVLDPATIQMFQRIDADGGNPQLGTFEVPVMPTELWAYIEGYERKLIAEAGINPADQQAMSGDPRSGYALSVSRDSQREAQRRFEPQFRRGDQEVLRLTAIMLNRAERTSYPESGYRVTYHGIPQSAPERAALRTHLLELLDNGLIDPVSAYQELHPGATDAEALTALRGIQRVKDSIADDGSGTGGGADVQALALNGAQVSALLDMVVQVATKQVPVDAAQAVARVAFPAVPETQLADIFSATLSAFVPAVTDAKAPDQAVEVSDGSQV